LNQEEVQLEFLAHGFYSLFLFSFIYNLFLRDGFWTQPVVIGGYSQTLPATAIEGAISRELIMSD
jgi:hypothetical protein